MRLSICLMTFLAYGPALGQGFELLEQEAAETRYGMLKVVAAEIDGYDSQKLTFAGRDVSGVADKFVTIQAIEPVIGAEADWVVISVQNGGNGCPAYWQVVRVDAAGATASPSFGTCSEGLMKVEGTAEGISLDIEGYSDPAIDHVTFTWDGTTVSETEVRISNEGATPPAGGAEATRWTGQHPALPFDDAGERLRFQAIMSEDQVFDLTSRVTVASPAEESDGFVVGQGFDPASGGDAKGMWGIRISDGAPFAIFLDTGSPPQIFGMGEENLPSAAVLFLQGIEE